MKRGLTVNDTHDTAAPQPTNGRTTNRPRESFTVFLLGLHVNAWYKPHRWLRTVRDFRRMQVELEADPALGLLHSRTLLSPRGTTVVQYWESTEALMRYARASTHSGIWRDFHRDRDGSVGIWHETYEIGTPQAEASGRGYEALYVDVPTQGLGAALGTEPVTRATHAARTRLARPSREHSRRARGGAAA
nr:DUF4188 domain-containing protein [Nocardiopsis mwathae]